MNRLKIVVVCGTALLIAAAVAVASRGRSRELPLPEVLVAVPVAEVRVVEGGTARNIALEERYFGRVKRL